MATDTEINNYNAAHKIDWGLIYGQKASVLARPSMSVGPGKASAQEVEFTRTTASTITRSNSRQVDFKSELTVNLLFVNITVGTEASSSWDAEQHRDGGAEFGVQGVA